ncbi:MAG: 3D domain-containing protein [Patescibacteria group bacterium]|nr:3D domain-containing protein [Patescibacteria group bacterium]
MMKNKLIKKILFGLIIIALVCGSLFLIFKDNFKFKLIRQMIVRPLAEVMSQYQNQACDSFSEQELAQGYFEALVTGYCRPSANNFADRHQFLCSVGLNCACPAGRAEVADCQGRSGLTWSACKDFDDATVDYCHQTASQSQPQSGSAAADWHCFNKNSIVEIENKKYLITDKGSAITGRRFDLWFDNCQDALEAIGIYKVKIPKQYGQ